MLSYFDGFVIALRSFVINWNNFTCIPTELKFKIWNISIDKLKYSTARKRFKKRRMLKAKFEAAQNYVIAMRILLRIKIQHL